MIERPKIGTRLELTIKDRDGSTVKLSGTLRREAAFELAKRLMDGANEFRAARAKATLISEEPHR
jgi:hypothetical protein